AGDSGVVCLDLVVHRALDDLSLYAGYKSFVCAARGDRLLRRRARNISLSRSPIDTVASGKFHDGLWPFLDHAVSFVLGDLDSVCSTLAVSAIQEGRAAGRKPSKLYCGWRGFAGVAVDTNLY